MKTSAKILFQMTGSIAGFKACTVLSRLVQDGHEVQVVITPQVNQFIGPATLEGLSGRPVYGDLYAPGQMLNHIHLAKWADLAVVCPATANTVNRLAAGMGDDCIGALFLAYDLKKPYLVAPAMNHEMIGHPTVKRSLEILAEMKVQVLPTSNGYQACGDQAIGRLLEPSLIYESILTALQRNTSERGSP
jgi:phosphopantothenoylcysteine decarboxylase/phosphopantothenate--cysteine ligase